jgi:hypothetical protein
VRTRRRISFGIPFVAAAAIIVFGPALATAGSSTTADPVAASVVVPVTSAARPISALADETVDSVAPPAVQPVADVDVHPVTPPVIVAVADIDRHPVVEPVVDSDIRPLVRPVVVLYGDSLAWEAQDVFVQAFADRTGLQIVVRTFGGTAICDWLDKMADDAATLAPGAVVVEFSGNAMTPCMLDVNGNPLTGAAYLDRYAADAEAVIATFVPTGAQVVFAGAPISRSAEESGDFNGGKLNAVYEQLARVHDGVRYTDAGATVLDEGHWTATLPCLPFEPCTGGLDASGRAVNVVRAPDGGHFCPTSEGAVHGVTGTCPVWSSGAFRYGTALAGPVIETLDASIGSE